MKIISVVGARPNFIKIAPFISAIDEYNLTHMDKIDHILVHTGQHYDERMNEAFFKALNIPQADINLNIGSGTHAEQVGQTMMAFEKVIRKEKPDWVVVVGDVNATLACSVTAKKEHIKVCHIEAGLRSGDERMPEEINRLVTDRLADLLLTPDHLSVENLIREGVPKEKIQFVGNIMIDTLYKQKSKAESIDIDEIIQKNIIDKNKDIPNIKNSNYALMTLHRPSNVDHKDILESIMNFIINEICKKYILIWPIHPRTKKMLVTFNLWEKISETRNLIILHPINYHDMLRLNIDSKLMLTDSGGLQEECTVLGTPCLTLRWNTERPITLVKHGGVNRIVGNDIRSIEKAYKEILNETYKPVEPEMWDGLTAPRCLKAIIDHSR
jgi:UDP-N-acetylglucosamine 2-epimerase (non-hydrolysing)